MVNKTDKSLCYHPSWSIYSSVKRLQRNKSEFLKGPPPPSMPLTGTFRGQGVWWCCLFCLPPVQSRKSHPTLYLRTALARPGYFPWNLAAISISSVQVGSVAQSCPTLCDPMDCSMPGLPVHHQLPEFTQTHAHRVGDAIQPSHPLSSPSPPLLPLPSQETNKTRKTIKQLAWNVYCNVF